MGTFVSDMRLLNSYKPHILVFILVPIIVVDHYLNCLPFLFFFFKQKTAYEIRLSLVGSEMCIRDSFGLLGYLNLLN